MRGTIPASILCAGLALGAAGARADAIEEALRAPGIHFGTSPLTWNNRVAELVAARGLSALDGARIHALVAVAISESYAEAQRSGHPCAPCLINPAVISILEQELDARLWLIAARESEDDQAAGRRIASRVMVRYPSISPAASSPAPAR